MKVMVPRLVQKKNVWFYHIFVEVNRKKILVQRLARGTGTGLTKMLNAKKLLIVRWVSMERVMVVFQISCRFSN